MALKESGVAKSEEAEQIGLAALVFLTEDAERLGRFFNDTGFSPTDLRAVAGTAEGQAAVLDYLLADESLLMVFAAGAGIDPAAIGPARVALAGGGDALRFASENHSSGHSTGRQSRKRPSKRWAGPEQ